jgi:hypothetical protein
MQRASQLELEVARQALRPIERGAKARAAGSVVGICHAERDLDPRRWDQDDQRTQPVRERDETVVVEVGRQELTVFAVRIGVAIERCLLLEKA